MLVGRLFGNVSFEMTSEKAIDSLEANKRDIKNTTEDGINIMALKATPLRAYCEYKSAETQPYSKPHQQISKGTVTIPISDAPKTKEISIIRNDEIAEENITERNEVSVLFCMYEFR